MVVRRTILSLSLFLSLAVPACELSADLGHDTPPDAGVEEDSSITLPKGPEPTPPTAPDVTLAEAKARCADPAHGPVDAYSDFAGLEKRLVGRWFACDRGDGSTDLFQREVGIEFHADHTWNLLRLDAAEKFVDQRGIDNEGEWGEKYANFLGYYRLALANDLVLVQLAFESAPRRLRTTDESTKITTWLVPLGVDTAPPRPR